jgi:hypothetical protein
MFCVLGEDVSTIILMFDEIIQQPVPGDLDVLAAPGRASVLGEPEDPVATGASVLG